MGGVNLGSVEGFIQGIKFPFTDPRRELTFALSGLASKRAGKEITAEITARFARGEIPSVYWEGKEIPFGSELHKELIRRAILEKFIQNPDAQNALMLTGNALLIHPIPDAPYTSLRAFEFVAVLSQIRAELLGGSVGGTTFSA